MVCFKLNGQNHDCTPEFRTTNLFYRPDDLKLWRCFKVVSLFSQQQLQISWHIPSSYINPHYGVWHSKSFVDRYSVGHSVPWVQHYAGNTPSCISVKVLVDLNYFSCVWYVQTQVNHWLIVQKWKIQKEKWIIGNLQTQHSLHRHKQGWSIESLKEDLKNMN